MKKILDVKYISCWDNCEDVYTIAKLNIESGIITDIEMCEVDDKYEIPTGQFVEYDDGTIEEVIEDDEYIIVSKSGLKFNTINIHNVEYIISDEMDSDDIYRILGIAKCN